MRSTFLGFVWRGRASLHQGSPGFWRLGILLCLPVVAAISLHAQYPVSSDATAQKPSGPVLRAVAVVEWTGEPGKPTASRVIPVSVFDGEQLQDGTVYLARPFPMAISGGVEYEIDQLGKPLGLFDVESATNYNGSWLGLGSWKPFSKPEDAVGKPAPVKIADPEDSEKPVLKRKHHADDPATPRAGGNPSSPSDSPAGKASAPDDPDRPVLKHKESSPDGASGSPSGSKSDDPDQPTLRRHSAKSDTPYEFVTSIDKPDPDRPRLKRGIPTGVGAKDVPELEGLPTTMQQAVAVSDARFQPPHPWTYAWANPGDEAKMKAALEAIARQSLGLPDVAAPASAPDQPTASDATPTTAKRVLAGASAKRKKSASDTAPASAPLQMVDEKFQTFELAYGSGATMVLSARTDGRGTQLKFVTIVAQPDLYGNPLVLLKRETDATHLFERPWFRLVDAVDAEADNRGELLFELRGDGQRQFALYRVLRGTADQIFATGVIP